MAVHFKMLTEPGTRARGWTLRSAGQQTLGSGFSGPEMDLGKWVGFISSPGRRGTGLGHGVRLQWYNVPGDIPAELLEHDRCDFRLGAITLEDLGENTVTPSTL